MTQPRIEKAMRRAPEFARNAANEHMQAFTQQMREKLGVEAIHLNEPYLPFALVHGELIYLRRLARLEAKMASTKALELTVHPLSDGSGSGDENNGPDLPEDDEPDAVMDIDALIDDEENLASLEMKQDLDGLRQPAFGIKQYVWVGGDCPLCQPNDGEIFTWGEGEEPGSVHPNCDCSAEPVLEYAGEPDLPLEPVYPVEGLLGMLAGGGLAWRLGMEAIRRLGGEGKPLERPKNVPKDWEAMPSNKGNGMRYRDPKNMHNEARVQKGKPEVSNTSQQRDYAKWKRDGQWLDKDGKPVDGNSPEAHIPLEDFIFDPEVFK